MRLVSLFAGIGGFDLGFERAGFEIVAHVECEKNCQKLLAAKWPNAVALDDVRTAGRHNLPDCDAITFWFPCQDLSVAGKRAGLKGKRSGLFYEAIRIINELRPAYAIWENVAGLSSSFDPVEPPPEPVEGGLWEVEEDASIEAVLVALRDINYFGACRVYDAQYLGVAQRRRRWIGLFARLDSGAERCAEILSIPEGLRGHPAPCRKAGEGITYDVAPCIAASGRGTERAGETRGQDCVIPAVAGCLSPGAHPGGCDGQAANTPGHLVPVALSERTRGDGSVFEIERDKIMPALKTGTQRQQAIAVPVAIRTANTQANGHGIAQNVTHTLDQAQGKAVVVAMQVRRLTPTECERLQGFDDGWTAGFSDSVRYLMLGNAVCVNVAEWIARRLAKEIKEQS